MKKVLGFLLVAGLGAAAIAFVLSAPETVSSQDLAQAGDGDAARGETLFWAGGCASCHAAPGAKGEAKLVLTDEGIDRRYYELCALSELKNALRSGDVFELRLQAEPAAPELPTPP